MKIPLISDWLTRYRAAVSKERYMRGYDFAAGLQLRGQDVEFIDSLRDCEPNEFDSGMTAAIRDFQNLLNQIAS